MAHAAAHLKKARELEQHPEYKALQKAREKRRRQRERAKRQVKLKCQIYCSVVLLILRLFNNFTQICLFSSMKHSFLFCKDTDVDIHLVLLSLTNHSSSFMLDVVWLDNPFWIVGFSEYIYL